MRRLILLAFGIPFNGGKTSDQASGPPSLDQDDDKFDILAKVRPGPAARRSCPMNRLAPIFFPLSTNNWA
jgi:hypothetical protein